MRNATFLLTLCLLAASCTADPGSQSTVAPETTAATSSVSTSIAVSTSTTVPRGTPLIIDTDMATEGVMSILYLLDQRDFDVRAITVSGTGLVHCDRGVTQVLGLLTLVGAEEVPVACGPEQPIEGHNAFPTSARVSADDLYGLELPTGGSPVEVGAPELIVSTIEEASVPVVIYADGPQTNLASALRSDPSIADGVEMVYAMGGAFETPGNTVRSPNAEWNIWVDPVAADEVFRRLPVTLVPLDATNQVPLTVFHRAALEEAAVTEAGHAVVTMLEGNESIASGGLYFWDQLTAALIVDPSYGSLEERSVQVVLDEDRSVSGVTRSSSDGPVIDVVTRVDVERFERDFLSALAGADVDVTIEPDWMFTYDGTEWSVDVPSEVSPGSFTIGLVNDAAAGLVVIPFGWLVEGTTLEEIDAWDSVEQPPFYEYEQVAVAPSGGRVYPVVELTEPRDYVLVGLDLEHGTSTRLAVVRVSG